MNSKGQRIGVGQSRKVASKGHSRGAGSSSQSPDEVNCLISMKTNHYKGTQKLFNPHAFDKAAVGLT